MPGVLKGDVNDGEKTYSVIRLMLMSMFIFMFGAFIMCFFCQKQLYIYIYIGTLHFMMMMMVMMVVDLLYMCYFLPGHIFQDKLRPQAPIDSQYLSNKFV